MLTTDIIYAVGIDFGHGETSFSYYNITWGKDISAQEPTENTAISLHDGKKTIPSIYLYNRNTDQMFVGKTAGINNGQIMADHSNYVYGASFKKPISRMSEDEKFLFKRYMMEIKKVLMCCSPVNLKDENLDENIKTLVFKSDLFDMLLYQIC
jgi:molecular chaperone DnaK (HSP70)